MLSVPESIKCSLILTVNFLAHGFLIERQPLCAIRSIPLRTWAHSFAPGALSWFTGTCATMQKIALNRYIFAFVQAVSAILAVKSYAHGFISTLYPACQLPKPHHCHEMTVNYFFQHSSRN